MRKVLRTCEITARVVSPYDCKLGNWLASRSRSWDKSKLLILHKVPSDGSGQANPLNHRSGPCGCRAAVGQSRQLLGHRRWPALLWPPLSLLLRVSPAAGRMLRGASGRYARWTAHRTGLDLRRDSAGALLIRLPLRWIARAARSGAMLVSSRP